MQLITQMSCIVLKEVFLHSQRYDLTNFYFTMFVDLLIIILSAFLYFNRKSFASADYVIVLIAYRRDRCQT